MFLISQDFWEVKNTPKKGRGIFAKKNISPGTIIGDYLGILILDKDYDEQKYGHYQMYYNKTTSIIPKNSQSIGIELINHSCSPNCDTYPYKGHTLYFANRYIFKDEELTVQYFLDPPEKNHVCNHICYCQSLVCHGTMHATLAASKLAEEFIKKHGEDIYENKLPVSLGQPLTKLESYPDVIYDDPIYDIFGNIEKDSSVCLDSTVPTISEIRKKIRKTGKTLYFTQLKFYVYGIMDGLLVGMKNK